MNKYAKQVQQETLNREKKTLEELKGIYKKALRDTEIKIAQLSARTDLENIQSIVYQQRYQEAIKAQLEGVLEELHSNEYATISDYLTNCYHNGYIGTMYDIAGQGMPLILPMDQEQIIKAIETDTKLSEDLYKTLGEDVKTLKNSIRREISRGIAAGSTWNEVANLLSYSFQSSPFQKALNRSMTIARTEGHRIQVSAQLDACKKAKKNGCEVVKQWDATLDGETRPTHRGLDGKIVEVNEKFQYSGGTVEAPGHFGRPSEDCNCRCMLLQRARWALDEEELRVLRERASYHGLNVKDSKEFGERKAWDFTEYKKKYIRVAEETAKNRYFEKKKFKKYNKGGKITIDIQFFAEKDIIRQESGSLKRAIKKYKAEIIEHEDKIKNPALHVPDWETKDVREQKGLVKHWGKEIRNFNKAIEDRIEELKKRGDYDE